ncbi:MAG: hypothetical protein WB770_09085, partial [Acidimicrobiales bacterium]
LADLGHNAMRLEGKLENAEFFEMADAGGIMVLAGWECCSKWEEKGPQGSAWSEPDFQIARRSMESEARLLRHHPSVIGFLIGSDFAPPPRAAEMYVEALRDARWDAPIISSATAEGTDAAGPSGMKMTGPYAWVPPGYWYSGDPSRGGAIGFNSETGAGGNIPRLANLVRMLSESELEDLWRRPDAKQFHAGPPSEFDNLEIFHRALSGRYGEITSLSDFVRKAQLANYEAVRAQFEAYRSRAFAPEPATGVIYWLLNAAWPSLNWQLYDWYLDPAGAYYGAKKGCEPVHVSYAYDTDSVVVTNHRQETVGPFELSTRVVRTDGQVVRHVVDTVDELAPRGLVSIGTIWPPETGEPTYFVALDLKDAGGSTVSRNVYWLSSQSDVLDWESSTRQYTPTSTFADLRGLERMPNAELETEIERLGCREGREHVRVRIRNTSAEGTPAVGVHTSFSLEGRDTSSPFPVFWDDNDVTVFSGDEIVLSGHCPELPGAQVALELEGFNLGEPRRLSG